MELKEFKIFNVKKYRDNRGYFCESFPNHLEELIGTKFMQDNLSFSKKGVVRGLHYQWSNPMGKLLSVIEGEIIDYIVDIRIGSPTFSKCFSFRLTGEDEKLLWIPPGFAHGFESIKDSYVHYKCSSVYNGSCEGSVNIFDEKLNINMQTPKKDVIMSERDLNAISFNEYCKDPKF